MDISNIVSQVVDELRIFIDSKLRNRYVYDEQYIVQLYTRKGWHIINGKVANTLDIANLVIEGGYRGNGIGSALINEMHAVNPFSHTFIESLLNTSLYDHLKANGWQDVIGSNPPSVFKLTNNEHPMLDMLWTNRPPQVGRDIVCHT